MRETSSEELEAVLSLDGPGRFHHFIKRVVDSEAAWGLWKEGWALMEDSDGTRIFALWPAKEYAVASRGQEWAGYEPEEIGLQDLVDDLLPRLEKDGVLPGVFPTPQARAVTPSVGELLSALRAEMAKYGD